MGNSMKQKQNLGNYESVCGILRTAVDEFLFYLSSTKDDPNKRAEWILQMIGKLSDLFLSGSQDYDPVDIWNKPGAIDAYLAEIFPFPSEDPKERMRTFFLMFFDKIVELNRLASTSGILDEQWQEGGRLVFQEFAMLLIGIPVGSEVEKRESIQVRESVALSGRQKAMMERWKDYP
jgi:hypothetical protein